MRKLLILVLSFLVATLLFAFLPSPARASGWEWRQNDWSGGPGQANWADNAMYDNSLGIDAISVPGTLRLSYLATGYVKEPTNPVLTPGAAGAWDATALSGLARKKDPFGYEVLYRGLDATGINAVGYADSPDGISWTKDAGNPVIQGSGQAWDIAGVGTGPFIKEGDTYKYWFSGFSPSPARTFGFAECIGAAGWTRQAAPALSPGAAGSWDERPAACQVIKDGDTYHMWYLAFDAAGRGQIGHATSGDGMTFTKDAANPILRTGTPGSWDESAIGSLTVMKRSWLGGYVIAYAGTNGVGTQAIGIATSPDGVIWTKDAANPVLNPGGAGSWNQLNSTPVTLTYDGSMYKMGIYGRDAGSLISSGEAYSFDGGTWFYSPFNPFLAPSAAPSWDDAAAIAGFQYLEGTSLRTFYVGIGTTMAMGTATSTPSYYGGPTWLESSVFSPGTVTDWRAVTWDENKPAGTGIVVKVRCGDTPTPDGTWTGWAAVANGANVPHANSRYIQYRVELSGPGNATPELSNLSIDFEALPSHWFFAEGYTGRGFDQWITIQNPNAATANVIATYYTPSGAPTVTNHTVPANSRYTIYVNSDLGSDLENSCDIISDQPVIVERPMYFDYQGTGSYGWKGGHVSMGSTGLSRAWYFAEGYTGNRFEEWLTVQNPNPAWATLDVTYYVNGGEPIRRQHLAPPLSRYTINVNQDAGADLELSAAIEADQPILVERPMYFSYEGDTPGGHIVMGSPYLDRDWFLAEGATFAPFTEYITIQNPNSAATAVTVTYLTPGSAPIVRNHTVPAISRYTINVGPDSGVASEVSTAVHADQPILVERPMYFDRYMGNIPGGHCAMGVNSTSTKWYFGEGYTGPGFDEWLTVQNPNAVAATLTVHYYVQGGAPITRNHTVPAQSRYTIPVDADAGPNLQVSAFIESNQPVICERPMYFFYQGYHAYNWPGGHDSPGFAP